MGYREQYTAFSGSPQRFSWAALQPYSESRLRPKPRITIYYRTREGKGFHPAAERGFAHLSPGCL
jgi:hypothetical protein